MDDDHINRRTDVLELLNIESEHTEEYPDLDEPWDELLERQELEDFEQAFGDFGGEENW